MTDIVDQMFPPVNRKWAPEYTDFNYWRAPVPEYELPEALSAPPSPTLSASARSDTSTQTTLSRLRHFSLGRSTSRGPPIEGSISSSPGRSVSGSTFHGGGHVRAASSLDRLGSLLPVGNGGNYLNGQGKGRDDGRRGADNIHVNSDELLGEDVRLGRLRNRMSTDSTLGSLDSSMERGMRDPRWFKDRELQGGEDEDEDEVEDEGEGAEEEGDDSDDEGDAEDAAEEAFDDDLLATGEMENVPFL
jgi:phosphatidate phosphatase LPIN